MASHDYEKHHLLELILWPNEDGTLKEIIHTSSELKELGIYEKDIMTISLTTSEHAKLHQSSKAYKEMISNRLKKAMKGRTFTDEHKQKLREAKKNISDDTRKKLSIAAKKQWKKQKEVC